MNRLAHTESIHFPAGLLRVSRGDGTHPPGTAGHGRIFQIAEVDPAQRDTGCKIFGEHLHAGCRVSAAADTKKTGPPDKILAFLFRDKRMR
jgi:hypothetical protein